MPKSSSKPSARSHSPAAMRRIYVLDTNVLMHDPAAIFRFEEHDIYLPMVVLEELDHHKKGLSEPARNVRQVSRFLDDMMRGADKDGIERGLSIHAAMGMTGGGKPSPSGHLFFQTRTLSGRLPVELPGQAADNVILAQTLALQAEMPRVRVTLVSKDINLRIKAAIVGIHAEDYYSDRTIDDADLLDSGTRAVAADFWEQHGKDMRSGKDAGGSWYELKGPAVPDWRVNQFIYEDAPQGLEAIVREVENDRARLAVYTRFPQRAPQRVGHHGAQPRAEFRAQSAARSGDRSGHHSGSGRHGQDAADPCGGLMQTLDSNRFAEIIMTRVTIPLGEDIGFLPGTEEEKMEPWMARSGGQPRGPHADRRGWQLGTSGDAGPAAQPHQDPFAQLHARSHVHEPLRHVDEAQNLTPKQMKALVTAAGPGTKMVCLAISRRSTRPT